MASPEASTTYLERYNFKTLMEWLTARCILHRPEDPMVFCRDLLNTHIDLSGGLNAPYDPACAPRLLKECYDDAMNAADEHGVINSEGCKDPLTGTALDPGNGAAKPNYVARYDPSPTALAPAETQPAREGTGDEQGKSGERAVPAGQGESIRPILLSIFQELCELARPEIAASAVVAGACKAVNARRGALYKVVNEVGELQEVGAGCTSDQGVVKPGQGLVGKAAATGIPGAVVAIPNPSKEEAFCAGVDLPRITAGEVPATGKCAPGLMYSAVKSASGGTWGILVVAEPASGEAFEEGAQEAFRAVSEMASVSIRNADVFGLGEKECEKFRNMVEVIEATKDDLGVNHLLYTIAKCLPLICDAQKCTCFLVDDDKDELWVVQGEVNMRVPKGKGIVGAVATSGNVENISDVYADPRFNKEVDVATGFQTHSILAMPVRVGEDNRVIAVVQLINKQGPGGISGASPTGSCASALGRHFTAQDAAVIGTFLSLLGPHILASTMLNFKKKIHMKVHKGGNGEQEAFPHPKQLGMHDRQRSMGSLRDVIDQGQSFQEGEEEED